MPCCHAAHVGSLVVFNSHKAVDVPALSCDCHVFDTLYTPGEHAGVWYLDLKSGAGSTGKGDAPVKADVVMSMDSGDFSKMFAGELSQPQQQQQQ